MLDGKWHADPLVEREVMSDIGEKRLVYLDKEMVYSRWEDTGI